MASQLATTAFESADFDRAEHVGMPPDELVVNPVDDVDHREPAILLGDRGVELDLIQEIAEFLDQGIVGRGFVRVERLERIDDLVCLLEQVLDQRLVSLLLIPRALLAQRSGELVEPDQ